ncbi:phosphatase PAP2 family protein [Paraburkholderia sp. BL25I1N1]|uniref:acid phosphatase n=1 Tax=Paraburkholderia sp. BL25I1N1 TaxID=1938804 RepID=UPI000D4F37A7|nr:phosphatase PAP2 family protein [Paraburkholderia sp. BL25I1N1]PRY06626.1 autotransporter-associated beta strand protein [Paraburkholderia sp. BL25I1N1]
MLFRFPRPRPLSSFIALCTLLTLSACGSGDDVQSNAAVVPAPPADPGFVDSASIPPVPAFVDNAASNQRNDAHFATLDTNAGVRVVARFLDLWQPSTMIVDAGASAPAVDGFPAVVASTCSGLVNSGTPCGTILNAAVLGQNTQFVVNETVSRTQAQADAAYFDDRRNKGYSVTDGLGPLTSAWLGSTQQTTTITSIPANATTTLYSDAGNNTGVGRPTNTTFGTVVDFVNAMSTNGSTEPAKRFYKYARPFRWSSSVVVDPTLVPAESATPATDGGFISGHTAEAMRDSMAMAYVVPQRFQEMMSRAMELGENRIIAGMHSPLDVIGGRMQGLAVVAANLYNPANASLKTSAYAQAQSALMSQTNTTSAALYTFAHSGTISTDRFADYATNQSNYLRRMTFGFSQIEATDAAPVVPKGAETLLETRFPYLSADQRRVVLKTTELPSGYPVMDDAEGWGRLNMFAAADGYGAFNGNVTVSMDATQGGFNAADTWRNPISGAGKLTVQGSGTLKLAGANTFSGGSQVSGGTLEADSTFAFGTGDVYLDAGTVVINAPGVVSVVGKYTQLANTTLELDIGANGQGSMKVGAQTTVVGGTLHVKFVNGFTPKVGDTINLISGNGSNVKFSTIAVDGFTVTPIYTSTGVQVHLDS